MISGATRGKGGDALARHLVKGGTPIEPRHLGGEFLKDQLRGLVAGAAHGRTDRPVYHVHVDPVGDRADEMRARYWELFEAEFGLSNQPMCGAVHGSKDGRPDHEHRAYSLVRPDGSTIDLSFDFARREKIGRIIEHEFGQEFTPGKHNRAVHAALLKERPDVAEAMQAAGLGKIERPVAVTSPRERHQQERTKVGKADIQKAVWSAWQASDNGAALEAALADKGLRLAMGDKVPVVVDMAGAVHPLARMVSAAAKAEGGKVSAKTVQDRLKGLSLPTMDAARTAVREARNEQADTAQSDTGHGAGDVQAGEDDLRRGNGRPQGDGRNTQAPSAGRGGKPGHTDPRPAGRDVRDPDADAPAARRDRGKVVAARVACAKLTASADDKTRDQFRRLARARTPEQAAMVLAEIVAEMLVELIANLLGRTTRQESADALLTERTAPQKQASEASLWRLSKAEQVVRRVRSQEPKGIMATLSGQRARWKVEAATAEAEFTAATEERSRARKTLEDARARLRPQAEREARANAAANEADRKQAEGLKVALNAVRDGDVDTILAARRGDIGDAVRAGKMWQARTSPTVPKPPVPIAKPQSIRTEEYQGPRM